MKKIILVLAVLSFTFGFAQNKNSAETKAVKAYTEIYNAQDYDAIYNLYSEESKKSTSLNRIKSYNERLYNTTGKINSVKYLGKDANSYLMYDLTYENTKEDALILYIKLDANQKIEGISFNKKIN